MAVQIHHGPAGSYKSSSVVWFQIVPALRAGRVVVTNVEGMYTLETIEKRLGETFPDTARLFRISSQRKIAKDLWRRWFHWMPLGALVVIDEVQDVYTKEKADWKESDLDYMPLEHYSEVLPPELYRLSKETHLSFKPEIDESTTDDTGELILDENGLIIYPPTMNEAFMRHRKFNWDIHLCTPDITQINMGVRAVAEIAISYKSNDWFFLSKRRPRLFEHNPKKNPLPGKKDVTRTQKVPVDVHLLYKSTQTGKITKSGASSGLFGSPKFAGAIFLVLASVGSFIYLAYQKLHAPEPSLSVTSHPAPAPSGSVGTQKVVDTGSRNAPAVNGRPVQRPRPAVMDLFLMPYDSTVIYWVGSSCHSWQQGTVKKQICDVVFELTIAGKRHQVHADELEAMGYQVFTAPYCYARLTDNEGNKKQVYCKPNEIKEDNDSYKQPYQINAGLIANNDNEDKPNDKKQANDETGAL